MAASNRKLVLTLVAVLLAVVVASAAIIWLVPGEDEPTFESVSESLDTTTPLIPETDTVNSGKFDLTPLEQAAYRNLNLPLITNGSLPVKPPAGGKANPFL